MSKIKITQSLIICYSIENAAGVLYTQFSRDLQNLKVWYISIMEEKQVNEQIEPDATLESEALWTRNFVRIWILNLLVCMWFFMINAPFPLYIVELGGTELLVGIVAGGYALTALLMRPFAGWLLDNHSRKWLLIAGLSLLIITSTLLMLFPILGVAVVLRIASGVLFAGTGTASTTNVYDTISPRRFAEGVGFLGLGNTLATALAPALGFAIIACWGFSSLFAVSVVVLLLAAIIISGFKYRKIEKPVGTQKQQGSFFSRLFNADALPASVVMLFTTVPYGGTAVFIALFSELYGLGNTGLYFTLFAVGTGSTRIISGKIADKKGEKPMVIVGNILIFISLMLLVVANTYCYYLSGLFFGIGSGVLLPAMQAMSMRIVPPERRGSATSTYLCSFDIASGAGGFFAGWVVTVWGYRPMFASLGIFIVISLLVYAFWASKTPSAFKVYQRNLKGEGI